MRSIRPFERDDIPQVTSLYEHVVRSGSRTPPPGMAAYFEEMFFDYPWADPEIPSLVYVDDDGRIAGFLGSSVRRLVFEGRRLRMAISGQLVTDPSVRNRAAGAFLLREYFAGPQDLTITDTASDTAQRIWEGLGGETAYLSCVGWVRIFRPWRFGWELLSRRHELQTPHPATRRVLSALDSVSVRVARRALRAEPTETTRTEELTPRAIAEHVPAVARSFRLRPAYEEEEFGGWLLGAMARVETRGTLVARLVRGGDRARGWYVYYLRPGGIAQVLQIAGSEHDVEDVLDDLFHDARSRGAAAIQGRVEAHLLEALSRRRSLFHASGYLALVHSRDGDILYTIQSGRGLLTRMEGEWWMGHHLEPFDDAGGRESP